VGAWVVDEFRKAVEMGYSFVDIFEILEYNLTHYVNDINLGDQFAQYVNMSLKLKTGIIWLSILGLK
jgi:hypothetical protein